MLSGVYFELEFSRRSITELARASLITGYPPFNPVLPPTGRVFPKSEDGTTWLSLNTSFSVEPGASYIRHGPSYTWYYAWEDLLPHSDPVTARRCEYVQKLRLAIARRDFQPGGAFIDVELGTVVEGTAVAEIGVGLADNAVTLSIRAKSFAVETPGLPPALVKTLQTELPLSFTTTPIPVPVQGVLDQPGANALTGPKLTNAGVTFLADLSVFAMRVQVGGEAVGSLWNDWVAFHAGSFPNRLLLPDGDIAQWGVLLSPKLVEQTARRSIEAQLAEHKDEFELIGGVTAHWAPEAGEARVNGDFQGELVIPCRPHYEVEFFSRLAVTAPNILTSSGTVEWDGDDLDLFVCEVLVALGVGVVGASVGAGVGGPCGLVVGFGFGLAVGFIGAVIFASVYVPSLSTSTCVYEGTNFTCTQTLNAGIVAGGQPVNVALTASRPDPDGLVLTGTFALPPIPALRHTMLQFDVAPFGYTELPVSCGNLGFALLISTSAAEAAKFTHAQAAVTVRWVDETGQARRLPWLTAERVSLDPQNVFPLSSISVSIYDDRAVVTVRPLLGPSNSKAYFDNPYGLRLDLRTLNAVRTVEIGAVQKLTTEDLTRLRDDALRKLNDCLAKQRDIGKRGGRFDLEWLIDPAPYEREAVRLWHVGLMKLTPGDRVVAEDMDGNRLAETIVDEHGIARLSVLTGAGPANRLLVLHRHATRDLRHEPDLRVQQIHLLPQGRIPLSGELRSVTTHSMNGRRFAVVQTTHSVALHDLTVAGAPRTHFQIDLHAGDSAALTDEGLAVTRGDSVTAWTFQGGLRRIEQAPSPASAPSRLSVPSMRRLHLGHTAESLGEKDAPAAVVEYYTAGDTVLVPSADGKSLESFAAGRRVKA